MLTSSHANPPPPSYGLSTIIVPGAGEPNFDSFEANPFMNTKQRQEAEVQTLLQKLSPDMIALDSAFVGTVDKVPWVARHSLLPSLAPSCLTASTSPYPRVTRTKRR